MAWPSSWIRGHRRGEPDRDPLIQVHAYDDRTVVLRQSMAVHFEAPFLFLLFGAERALLLDNPDELFRKKAPPPVAETVPPPFPATQPAGDVVQH